MIIYLSMMVISIVFAYLVTKTNKKSYKIVFGILASLPFFIVSAIRYDVGTDYSYRYIPDFNKIANGIDVKNLELGFKLIIRLCLIVSENYQLLFVITSGIITILIMSTIFEESKQICISVLIFFIGGFFFQSLNLIRQFIAMAIVFFSYRYLWDKKKYWMFIVGMICAYFIHSSSIIMIILLFLKRKTYMNPVVLLVGLSVIFALETSLMNIIAPFIENTRFGVYLVGRYAKGDISYIGIAINLLVYAFMYVLYRIKKKNNQIGEEDKLLINIQGLALVMMSMSSVHILFARIAYFFTIFQIISIPYFIETTKVKEIHLGEKWTKNSIYLLVILCLMVNFSYTNILNNDNEPLPYRTIFNKEKEFK